ncbi:MAG TPA: RNA polymerase sigma factor, partial [Candidatus Limnocylindrales bacterium]|nr:RNA polymerase sigma factor [Candidatus Limnocylindrales bacterium]
ARIAIGRLYVIARLILREDSAAEDATQEALVAAWQHIRAVRDPDKFEAWLHRTLVRACYREYARRTRRRTFEARVATIEPSAPDTSNNVADRDELERGFRRLDFDQRAVLVTHYYLGLGLDEAAIVLGLPPGTVRSRLHRAMRAMRATLDADARAHALAGGRIS